MITVVIETRTTTSKLNALTVKTTGNATIITEQYKLRFNKQRVINQFEGRDNPIGAMSGLSTNERNECKATHRVTGYPKEVVTTRDAVKVLTPFALNAMPLVQAA